MADLLTIWGGGPFEATASRWFHEGRNVVPITFL